MIAERDDLQARHLPLVCGDHRHDARRDDRVAALIDAELGGDDGGFGFVDDARELADHHTHNGTLIAGRPRRRIGAASFLALRRVERNDLVGHTHAASRTRIFGRTVSARFKRVPKSTSATTSVPGAAQQRRAPTLVQDGDAAAPGTKPRQHAVMDRQGRVGAAGAQLVLPDQRDIAEQGCDPILERIPRHDVDAVTAFVAQQDQQGRRTVVTETKPRCAGTAQALDPRRRDRPTEIVAVSQESRRRHATAQQPRHGLFGRRRSHEMKVGRDGTQGRAIERLDETLGAPSPNRSRIVRMILQALSHAAPLVRFGRAADRGSP